MKAYSNIRIQKPPEVAPGDILISQGFWNDAVYSRTVVLILDHDLTGTTGIIINKASDVKIQEAFPDLDLEDYLFYGGPFDSNLIGFVHDCATLPNAILIANDLYWCGDMNELKRGLEAETIVNKRIKFFVGFVEWSPGELSQEIEEKKWWVDQLTRDDLFDVEFQSLWAHKLVHAGNVYGLLHEIDDPSLN